MANKDNPRTGSNFEGLALSVFKRLGLPLQRPFRVDVGIGQSKKPHKFDLGSAEAKLLVECRSHTWTSGGNSPSAKMAVWNEAMYYFVAAPTDYRKVLFILMSVRNGETLGQHYLKRFEHLIPQDVEILEYDPSTETTALITRPEAQEQWQNHPLHKSGTES